MELDLSLTPSVGMAGGMVYQFAEGRWQDGLGEGLVMSEVAYDFVEPLLDLARPGTGDQARYGVAEFDPDACRNLAAHFRRSAVHVRSSPPAEEIKISDLAAHIEDIREAFARHPQNYSDLGGLLSRLADWLERAAERSPIVSLLGL